MYKYKVLICPLCLKLNLTLHLFVECSMEFPDLFLISENYFDERLDSGIDCCANLLNIITRNNNLKYSQHILSNKTKSYNYGPYTLG